MWTLPKFAAAAIAEEVSTSGNNGPTKAVENDTRPVSGIEDLFKDSSSLATPSVLEKPQKDVKNDIMSLFEKVYALASLSHLLNYSLKLCLMIY